MKRSKMKRALIFWFLVFIAAIYMFPIFWFFLLSIKPFPTGFVLPPKWDFTPDFSSYVTAFTGYASEAGNFQLWYTNSISICLTTTVLSMAIAVPAAYSFARFRFRGRRDLLFWLLTNRMVPPITALLPLYLMMSSLKILDTWAALILVYLIINVPFSVWMMKGFFEEIPSELEEAALVDGCSRWQAFIRVVVPIAIAGLAATATFSFIFAWNDFIFALILTGYKSKTVMVGIAGFWSSIDLRWTLLAAAGSVYLIPPFTVAMVFRKYIIRGMTFGAVKG